jgi:hypothetical protein
LEKATNSPISPVINHSTIQQLTILPAVFALTDGDLTAALFRLNPLTPLILRPQTTDDGPQAIDRRRRTADHSPSFIVCFMI